MCHSRQRPGDPVSPRDSELNKKARNRDKFRLHSESPYKMWSIISGVSAECTELKQLLNPKPKPFIICYYNYIFIRTVDKIKAKNKEIIIIIAFIHPEVV